MKIYTKTGDKGRTSLVGGQRVSKCCERIESYGTIDELNSHIGVLATYCTDPHDTAFLADVQNVLFIVGGRLATASCPADSTSEQAATTLPTERVEQEIDRLQSALPQLRAFVLPGGSRGAAYAHVCRTVCRRAERCIWRLAETGAEIDTHITAYVNRLSDYLFVLARKLNADAAVEDVFWVPIKE